MASSKAKTLLLMAVAMAIIIAIMPLLVAPQSSQGANQQVAPATTGNGTYGAYVYSTSATVANVSVYIPFGSNNTTSLRDITVVIYGSVAFNVSYNGRSVETGFSTSEKYVNFTLGNGTYNLTVKLNHALYGQITNLHTTKFVSVYALQGVYIYSTYKGQSQQLYAAPGQTNILMYPIWNITMYSSTVTTYSVYVNAAFVSSGTFVGVKQIAVDVNTSVGSAVIGVGNTIYKFTNLPISSVPLKKYYAPPAPALAFTAEVLDEYLVKAGIASGLSLVAAVLIVGRITVSKLERTVVG